MGKKGDILNELLLPIRLIVPQPYIRKLPLLRTNEDERIMRVLAEYRGKALDIGCGNNRLIKIYRSKGHNGLGVDVYNWDGPDMIVKDTTSLPFDNEEFDTISFVASINHIPNRLLVLKEAYRLLKLEGRLLITALTPRISLFWHKFAYWDNDQRERGMSEGEVYGFSANELKSMVSEAGFQIISKRSFMWGLNNLYIFSKAFTHKN